MNIFHTCSIRIYRLSSLLVYIICIESLDNHGLCGAKSEMTASVEPEARMSFVG